MPLLLLWHPRVHVETDQDTVYLRLTPSAVEIYDASDSATVYLDLQPGSIFLQVDFLLAIVGTTSRWRITMQTMKRWVILETRKFIWRG